MFTIRNFLSSRPHCRQPNKVSWRNVHSIHHAKFCAICDHVAQRINCSEKKLLEYDYTTHIGTVHHLGTHKCSPQLPGRVIPVQHLQMQVSHTLMGSAKVGLRQIVSLIDTSDMDAAEKEAKVWLKSHRSKWKMESMDLQQGMDHNFF